MEIKQPAKWKAVKVRKFSRLVSRSLALSPSVIDMVVTEMSSVDLSGNVGVWIDTVMSCQEQRPKECLTAEQMVSPAENYTYSLCRFWMKLARNYVAKFMKGARNNEKNVLICRQCKKMRHWHSIVPNIFDISIYI